MTILPTSELTQIRTDLETTLPDAGTIYSLTRASDGQGSWTEVWGTAGTCACRLDFIGGAEAVTNGALMPYTRAIVTMPQATSITTANRFVHSTGTYTVQSVNIGSWLGVKRATVQIV